MMSAQVVKRESLLASAMFSGAFVYLLIVLNSCFTGSPCGPPSSNPQSALDSNKIERKEYCSTKLDWLKDLNECSTPSPCPKDGSASCPSGYKCVDCRAQTDTPTLEVRCIPHSRHTSVEGCSVRCCMLE